MVAIDTNLLVYAIQPAVPEYAPARRALTRAAASGSWGISQVCALEFWSTVTRMVRGRAMASALEAAGFLVRLEAAGCQRWVAGDAFLTRLLALAMRAGAVGPKIFDLAIGLTALDNGATEIWTHDQQFTAPAGLRVFDPLLS